MALSEQDASTPDPTVEVTRRARGGGFNVQASVLMPGCTVESVYQSLTNFDNHVAWNPAIKELRPVDTKEAALVSAARLPAPTTKLAMVQDVSFLTFHKAYTTLMEVEKSAERRSVHFRMVSSGLYHDYSCAFVVEPLDAAALANTTVLVVAAGAVPAPNDTPKAGLESKGRVHASVGARVQYNGHFRLKTGPPPPLGRMLVPRALHSATLVMLSKLQTSLSSPRA